MSECACMRVCVCVRAFFLALYFMFLSSFNVHLPNWKPCSGIQERRTDELTCNTEYTHGQIKDKDPTPPSM